MNDKTMKRKNPLNKIINNQIIVTCVTMLMVVFVLMGSSYAVLSNKEESNDASVNIKIGNQEAVLSSDSSSYTFSDNYQKPVSDVNGLNQKAYTFSLTNTGGNKIGYYEIRMVDQENKSSTLPHKYIRFAISVNNGEYSKPSSLGDVNSIIYSGYDLPKGDSINFNLKMWIDEMSPSLVYNKELYGALEVTLYQKYDAYDYYVLYDINGGTINPVRTTLTEPITSVIPERANYYFLGWSSEKNGDVLYYPGDTYSSEKGQTLYAVWKSA